MDLSKTVACTALIIVVVLSAGHALADVKGTEEKGPTCIIKPVMSDAEIEVCRIAYRRR